MTSSPDAWAPLVLPDSPRAVSLAGAWLVPLHVDAAALAATERERSAFERGREEGRAAERRRADDRCRTALAAVAEAAAHLDELAGEFARDRERDLHALAVAIARSIVRHDLTVEPGRLEALVRDALALLPADDAIEVRLHPDDLETLATALVADDPGAGRVRFEWRADTALERGSFMIETPHRIIDGRSDVALRELYDRLDHD